MHCTLSWSGYLGVSEIGEQEMPVRSTHLEGSSRLHAFNAVGKRGEVRGHRNLLITLVPIS